MIVGLDHVQVAAPPGCEDDARRFYGELLGLEELAKPALLEARGGAWFRAGTHELHVGVADDFRAATKAHPAFRVDSVEELERLAARLEEQGLEVAVGRPRGDPGDDAVPCPRPVGESGRAQSPDGPTSGLPKPIGRLVPQPRRVGATRPSFMSST